MHYYRVKVIKTILQAGLRVDVFGNSWMNCALAKYANLICHADVSVAESFDVFRQSKLSLNVMSWHKEGFTERMANIMLCKSVLVTDDTSYLNGKLQHGEELLVFRLDALDKLPDILREYLEDSEKRDAMARNGFEKALKNHTWNSRSKEFIESILG